MMTQACQQVQHLESSSLPDLGIYSYKQNDKLSSRLQGSYKLVGDFLWWGNDETCHLVILGGFVSQKTACRKGCWVEDLVCTKRVDYQEFETSIWGWPSDGDFEGLEGVCEWHLLLYVYLSSLSILDQQAGTWPNHHIKQKMFLGPSRGRILYS